MYKTLFLITTLRGERPLNIMETAFALVAKLVEEMVGQINGLSLLSTHVSTQVDSYQHTRGNLLTQPMHLSTSLAFIAGLPATLMVAMRPQNGLPFDCSPIIPAPSQSQGLLRSEYSEHTMSERKNVFRATVVGPSARAKPSGIVGDVARALSSDSTALTPR